MKRCGPLPADELSGESIVELSTEEVCQIVDIEIQLRAKTKKMLGQSTIPEEWL